MMHGNELVAAGGMREGLDGRTAAVWIATGLYMPLTGCYIPLYPAISRYIPLYPTISHYIPLYPAIFRLRSLCRRRYVPSRTCL